MPVEDFCALAQMARKLLLSHMQLFWLLLLGMQRPQRNVSKNGAQAKLKRALPPNNKYRALAACDQLRQSTVVCDEDVS